MPVDFETFLTERRYLKGICERTVEYYRDCFHQFGNNPTPDDDYLKQFVIRLRQRGMKETSCNDYIRGVNAYLNWADSRFLKSRSPSTFFPPTVSRIYSGSFSGSPTIGTGDDYIFSSLP